MKVDAMIRKLPTSKRAQALKEVELIELYGKHDNLLLFASTCVDSMVVLCSVLLTRFAGQCTSGTIAPMIVIEFALHGNMRDYIRKVVLPRAILAFE